MSEAGRQCEKNGATDRNEGPDFPSSFLKLWDPQASSSPLDIFTRKNMATVSSLNRWFIKDPKIFVENRRTLSLHFWNSWAHNQNLNRWYSWGRWKQLCIQILALQSSQISWELLKNVNHWCTKEPKWLGLQVIRSSLFYIYIFLLDCGVQNDDMNREISLQGQKQLVYKIWSVDLIHISRYL